MARVMRATVMVAMLCFFLAPVSALAQELHGTLGIDFGYLIAGGNRSVGPTGGVVIIPKGALLFSPPGISWLDITYTQQPMVVSPTSLEALGFLDANDLGVYLHPANRRGDVGIAGTFAVAYMNFCNNAWCLREWTMMPGAEAHVRVRPSEGGRFLIDLSGRVLYGRPTAWTWPGVAPINPAMWMIVGGGTWEW